LDLRYVCRTAKNSQLYQDDLLFSFGDLWLHPGDLISLPNVWFTQEGYGPVLGWVAIRKDWIKVIHRTDRCDWSVFRLGLALLDYLLNESLPIPVSFTLLEQKSVR
jgi:hypothetical protein